MKSVGKYNFSSFHAISIFEMSIEIDACCAKKHKCRMQTTRNVAHDLVYTRRSATGAEENMPGETTEEGISNNMSASRNK